jgi:hypothetical protein
MTQGIRYMARAGLLASVLMLAGCGGGAVTGFGGQPVPVDPQQVVLGGRDDGTGPLNLDDPLVEVKVVVVRHSSGWRTWAARPDDNLGPYLRSRNTISETPIQDPSGEAWRLQRIARKNAARETLRVSFDLLQRGDAAAAFRGFRQAIEAGQGDNPQAQFYLAEAAVAVGRYIDAAEAYRNTIGLAPDGAEALQARGRIDSMLADPAGGLRERVFQHATNYERCMSKYLAFDFAARVNSGIPSARSRYVEDCG